MNKTLLALMTAGTIGCGGYSKGLELNNPIDVTTVDITTGEYILKDVSYLGIDIERNSTPCRKWVSAAIKEGRLSSVRETTHCLYDKDQVIGIINSVRYDSTDGDEFVDRRCTTDGMSYLGVKSIYETCVDVYKRDKELLLVVLQKLMK